MVRRRRSVIIGFDVHKRETQVAFLDGENVTEKRIRTTPSSFARVLRGIPGPVALEAVGFHRPIVRWLEALDREIHLANTRSIPKPKVKTDKKDAKHLAKLLRGDNLPEAWIPPEDIQELRDLVRHRRFLGEQTSRLKSKIKHDLLKHGHFLEKNPADTKKGHAWARKLDIPEVSSCLTLLDALEQEIDSSQEKIEAEANKRNDVKIIASIPGIAEYTALGIYAEVGDFSRFPRPESLASYAGLSIQEDQSGDRQRKGNITKDGNTLLLTLLVEAVHNHVRVCPDSTLSNKFKRWQEKKGTKKAAIATARTLLHILYAMIRDQKPFTVNPENPNERHAA